MNLHELILNTCGMYSLTFVAITPKSNKILYVGKKKVVWDNVWNISEVY